CFERGNWELGLPLLAVADDESLKFVAAKELIEGSRTAGDEKALADDWWELGEKHSGHVQERVRSRATYWYRRAVPQLSGFAKATAAARIKEFENARNGRQGRMPLATTAAALESQAQLCPTAEEAYSLYKAFLSEAKVAPEVKTSAEARLAY